MYIDAPNRYYTYDGQQKCGRGRFLILCDTPNDRTMYAIVRKVALSQVGHWMMGSARIYGKTYTISGSYGNDGLPCQFDSTPSDAKRVPDHLVKAWNEGGGWNGAGSEAQAMREWALETFK